MNERNAGFWQSGSLSPKGRGEPDTPVIVASC